MTYDKEFKEQALKLSDEVGVRNAAAQLGIPYYTIADWRSARKHSKAAEAAPVTDKDARIKELEKQNRELKQANEILKDALGFFALDRKK